ncbi:unnamed protein product [Sphenostylis stenocarpa]|uniref:Uncharacterized protein n=1 Tax=Sphenostylis stenocarpa TaxID=92480 RepID=A0AA86VH47_9FABA|nr:unnamed protein product [Sphenostylis stenocarpa]
MLVSKAVSVKQKNGNKSITQERCDPSSNVKTLVGGSVAHTVQGLSEFGISSETIGLVGMITKKDETTKLLRS